jgi:hypothetical protein
MSAERDTTSCESGPAGGSEGSADRISVLKMRSSPHAWLNFILLSTTFIIMNSHIEIGKQNKYLNNKHLISMQVVDVESVTSFGERND